MSLLNNVLRDLQTRGALGVEPLTGLEPVTEAPAQHRWRALLLPALAALSVTAAIVLWRPVADGRWLPSFAGIMVDADVQPRSKLQTVPQTSPQAEPDRAATSDNATTGNNAAIGGDVVTGDDAAISDISSGVTPINTTSELKSPPVDDYVPDTQADSPPSSQVSTEAAVSPGSSVATVAPATATMMRRETGDAATAAARSAARGLVAMRGDDLPGAERLFREALTIDPGVGTVWGYLYSTLVRASKPAAAEQALRRGLISAKEPAPLAKLYARLLLDRGEKDAAVGILRTHRPVAATETEYDAFLAALLQQLGQYAEAGEIYRKLLTIEPGSGSWWIGLAMSSDSIGNRPEALSAFQRALRTDSLKTPLATYARRRSAELQAYD